MKKSKKTTRQAPAPDVLIVAGSESDLAKLDPAVEILDAFRVPHVLRVASAHRTPEYLDELIREFTTRGGSVIIAAAGKSAHLPGVAASKTRLPVIGVPISASLMGIDALLSIVQMPPDVPVAAVGIDASRNAALLAVQILALQSPRLAEKLRNFREKRKNDLAARYRKISPKAGKNA
ncbi:MAG: 5-(carboxyamino)imidazole ribonucleotide mutase [bacterium]